VINTGRERQNIFHGEAYFRAFLDTLAEAHQRFGCVVHSYCLMSNHYHVLSKPLMPTLAEYAAYQRRLYTAL